MEKSVKIVQDENIKLENFIDEKKTMFTSKCRMNEKLEKELKELKFKHERLTKKESETTKNLKKQEIHLKKSEKELKESECQMNELEKKLKESGDKYDEQMKKASETIENFKKHELHLYNYARALQKQEWKSKLTVFNAIKEILLDENNADIRKCLNKNNPLNPEEYVFFENHLNKLTNVFSSLTKPITMNEEFKAVHELCFVDIKDHEEEAKG